ncbi:MAG: hypothetical protein PHT95_04435 [Candidatus Omnitrophica bacterium]|jgi:hypothetical protein|nr:hypothetical protein [Candidatus Omnitrophota bacterium]MDD4012658.1 hypothetical protein [Candidatus Omnitrophota bacterium]
MKRLAALTVLVVCVLVAGSAFAADTAAAGTGENGWQQTYDWIGTWSWGSK